MQSYKQEAPQLSDETVSRVHELVHQLYQTTRALTKSINRALDTTTIYGSEWTILRTIHEKGTMTQTALSNYLNIEPAAISKTLRQLVNKNLIERHPGEDRREKYIYLSEEAEQNYPTWSLLIKNNCRKITTSITREEKDDLITLLSKVQDALEYDE